jgi:hypothetical protein
LQKSVLGREREREREGYRALVVYEGERTRQEKRTKLSSLDVEDLLIKALFFPGMNKPSL